MRKKESVQRSSLVRAGKWDQRASNSATFQLLAPKVEKLARCDELAINPLLNPLFFWEEISQLQFLLVRQSIAFDIFAHL
jgi:hypothetical protein